MRSLLLLAALLAAACLAHGAESAPPRRSLTFDLFPTGCPHSDWDKDNCWRPLLALGLCKHDLLASFFTGRPVPAACCRAAGEVSDHCGPFTRAFVGSLLPRGPMLQCARPVITGAPTTRPIVRRAPPRAPSLATGPRVPSGGARPPPGPEAQTSARFPPPRAPKPTPPEVYTGVHLPPPYPPAVSPGTHAPPPKAASSGARAPAVSGGTRQAGVRGAPTVPVYESAPKPKVIAGGGSAGGRTRRAPDVYGAARGGPLPAAAAPQKGVRTARPSPKSVPPHGPAV